MPNDIIPVEVHPVAPVAPVATPPALPEAARGPAQLAQGLAKARQSCKAVEKDSFNSFHRYQYASSEAILAEARAALDQGGLVLVPLHQSINGHDAAGEHRYELYRKFLLLHSSGEFLTLDCHWPVVVEKGRPLDKAAAIADTLSLAYLLRDLLQMPRVSPSEEVDAREDAAEQKEKPAPSKPTPPVPTDADAQIRLKDWIRHYCLEIADVCADMRVQRLQDLPADSCKAAVARMRALKLTPMRAERIQRRLDQLDRTVAAAVQFLGLDPTTKLADLTNEQADRLEKVMEPKGRKAAS